MRTLAAVTLLGLTTSVALAAPRGGLGPYKIGMKPAEVEAVKDCTPYKPVASTGGLECPAFSVAGKKRNISFVFDPGAGLKKIQVWFYEGKDAAAAETAVAELIEYAKKQHGALESNSLPAGTAISAKALIAAAGKTGKAQLKPTKDPGDSFVFASVAKHPDHGWYVFYYVQPPR